MQHSTGWSDGIALAVRERCLCYSWCTTSGVPCRAGGHGGCSGALQLAPNPSRARRKEADAAARLLEEEEMAQRVEERVRERVEAAMASPEVQARIEARLREERAALEQKVGAWLSQGYACEPLYT